ncbi:MAG: hypothetical protein V4671_07545, partial [Armatimonadota bacterium]
MPAKSTDSTFPVFRSPFVINDTPHCLSGWVVPDWEMSEQNRRYIDSIDPGYFAHIANLLGNPVDATEENYAAALLRQTYSQGLETLF